MRRWGRVPVVWCAATHCWGGARVLALVQAWVGEPGWGAARLVVLTHGAVGLAGADITDLAGAAIWGLVRSAQSENPGRIVLLLSIATRRWMRPGWRPRVVEPQLLVRGAAVYAARLAASALIMLGSQRFRIPAARC